jgi:UDP-N-acetylmuramoylalanine-D-glutamate ligase
MARKKNEFPVAADKRPMVVKAQRDLIRAMADRLESGKPFARAAERKLAADILRQWAKHVPDDMPEYVDPAQLAIHFACLVNMREQSRVAAIAELADIYSVPLETISAVLEKFEEPAMRLVPTRADAA